MILLFDQDVAVAAWVGARLKTEFVPPYVAIGVVTADGALIGGAVFTDFNGCSIEITIWGPGAFTKGVLCGLFDYAFHQVGALSLGARTRRDAERNRAIFERAGFRQEGVRRCFYGPAKRDDAILYGMLRQEAVAKGWISGEKRQAA